MREAQAPAGKSSPGGSPVTVEPSRGIKRSFRISFLCNFF